MSTERVLALPPKRDYPKLVNAMSEVVRALKGDVDEEETLRRSFEFAVKGFQSQRAVLLLVDDGEPPELRRLEAKGLTEEQVLACESGKTVKGVSSKLIRAAIGERRLKLVKNPFFLAEAEKTLAFESTQGEHYSAMAVPLLDAAGRTRAVMYLSNAGHDPAEAYEEADARILQDYAEAVGHVFAAYLDRQRRDEELRQLRVRFVEGAPELIGDSVETAKLRRLLHEVYIPAATSRDPEPLLVLGESGTGKDLVARYVHVYGARRGKPFRVVNCGEITDELAAARFSGHAKGAFTSADRAELGFFRSAHGGVLFLDEVGELSLRAQAALLRAIDSRTVVPVGETQEHKVDVYLILATNRDLEREVQEKRFRADLYRRFKTSQVRLPPLRERPWDVPLLVAHFLRFHEARTGKKTLGLTEDAMRALMAYPWPGNVREVKTVCGLIVMHAKVNERLSRQMVVGLYPDLERPDGEGLDDAILARARFREATYQFQRELILSRIELYRGDVRAAQESLGIHKNTFRSRLKVLGLADVVRYTRDDT